MEGGALEFIQQFDVSSKDIAYKFGYLLFLIISSVCLVSGFFTALKYILAS